MPIGEKKSQKVNGNLHLKNINSNNNIVTEVDVRT